MSKTIDSESISMTNNMDVSLSTEEVRSLENEAILASYELRNYESTSGPIPSPKIMKGYAELDPSLPDRIIKMAERQQEHEMAMDNRQADLQAEAMRRGFSAAKRGQWLGAALGLILIGCSVWMAIIGQANVAITLIVSGLAIVLGAYVKNRIKKEKD